MKLYQAIVNNELARFSHPTECAVRDDRILNCLPSGSGFTAGTRIISVSDSRIVIEAAFLHRGDSGYYDSWEIHRVTCAPSLLYGIKLTVSGKNKNDVKDYIYDLFYGCLMSNFNWIEELQE